MESKTHDDGGHATATAGGGTDGRTTGLSIFSGQPQGHVSDMMSPPEMPAGLVLDFDPSVLAEGTTDDVLFGADRADGFSLTKIRLAPNYILPTHHHDVDCLYYVESGWILLGRRRIAAGGGFMVRAETPYGYRAGSAGATVLEFRASTRFNMVVTETSPAKWREIAQVALDHDGWRGFAGSHQS